MRMKYGLFLGVAMLWLGVAGLAQAQPSALSVRWEEAPTTALFLHDMQSAAVGAQLFAAGQAHADDVESVLLNYHNAEAEWRALAVLPGRILAMQAVPESPKLLLLSTHDGAQAATELHTISLATAAQGNTSAVSVTTETLSLPFIPNQARIAWRQGKLYLAAISREQDAAQAHFGEILLSKTSSPAWRGMQSWSDDAPEALLALSAIGNGLYLLGRAGEDGTLRFLLWNAQDGWQDTYIPEAVEHPVALHAFGANHGLLFTNSNAWWQYHPITETWVEMAAASERPGLQSVLPYTGGFMLWHEADQRLSSSLMWPVPRRGGLNWLDYSAILLYFAVLVGIGVFFSRREGDTVAFFLGNRRVPWWAMGLSIFGTALSPITYLSIPARAFAADWVFLLAYAGIVMMGPIVIYFYLPHFRRAPISTAYEYLELRFNWATRVYGSICFILYQGLRVSFMLFLPAITLSAVTGLDIYLCILAMGVLATLYTVMGGIEAVIWTDVLQTIVLTTGLLLAIGIVVLRVDGGPLAMIATAHEADKFHMINWGWGATTATLWVVLLGNLFSSFYPQTADQTIVQRYLTTRTEKEAARAVWTNALLHIPLPLLFFGLGTALWVYFRSHPENMDPTLQNDAVLPLFIVAEFPLGLRGVIIAGIFAAAMSSLDSSVNSVASVLVNDYYRRWKRDLSERQALRMSRIISLLFGAFGALAAMFVARLNALSLWDPFLEFLGLVGSGLAGVVALGVFTTRSHGAGALTGAALSAVVLLIVRETSVHFFLYAVIGFLTAFIGGWLASFVLPGKPRSLTTER